jgi:Asp-tRNA(Asn)/Glu-tRNA(Gln) amidotransferase A subunit family amidase
MQGLFANRPSTGAVSLDDVIPLCHALDTAGAFSRNAATWSKVLHAWYQNFTDYREYPKKIFYQESSFPATNTSAGAMLEEFVVKVEDFLATKREHVNISSQWEKTHPSTTAGAINNVLNTVGFKLSKIYHHMLMEHNRHTLSWYPLTNTAPLHCHSTQTTLRSMRVAGPSLTQALWRGGPGARTTVVTPPLQRLSRTRPSSRTGGKQKDTARQTKRLVPRESISTPTPRETLNTAMPISGELTTSEL